jgi:hypothetical protein
MMNPPSPVLEQKTELFSFSSGTREGRIHEPPSGRDVTHTPVLVE